MSDKSEAEGAAVETDIAKIQDDSNAKNDQLQAFQEDEK